MPGDDTETADSWRRPDGSRYRTLGAMRRQRSRTTPEFDPVNPLEDDLRVASKIEVYRCYSALVESGHESDAEKFRDPEHVSSFSDQQWLSIELIRKHDLG